MAHQLSRTSKLALAIKRTTAVSSSDTVASTGWDMTGFQSVRAIVALGQTSADGIGVLAIQGSTASTGTFATLSGSTSATVQTTTGLMDGLLVVDVNRVMNNRYVRATFGANGTTVVQHGGVILEFYNPTNVPTTDDSTSMLVAQKVVWETT